MISLKKKNSDIIDDFDYLSNAASSQDCTGLIPATPASDAELESYEDLYHFLPPHGHASTVHPGNKYSQKTEPSDLSYKHR
ncbi:MAG: hypothetical protein ACI4V6_04055 [Dorea sp.]